MDQQQADLDNARKFELDTTLLERKDALERQNFLNQLNADQRAQLEGMLSVADELTLKIADLKTGILGAIDPLIAAAQQASQQAKALAAQYSQAGVGITGAMQDIRSSGGGVRAQYLVARNQFNTTEAAALGGDLTALNALPGLAKQFLSASQAASPNPLTLRRDQALIQNALGAAADAAKKYGAIADYQSKLYDIDVNILTAIKDNLSQATINTDLLKQQLGALNDVTDLIKGSNDALAATKAALTSGFDVATGQIKDTGASTVSGLDGTISELQMANNLASLSAYQSTVDSQTLLNHIVAGNSNLVQQIDLLIRTLNDAATAATNAAQSQQLVIASQADAAAVATTAPHKMTGYEAALSLGPISGLWQGHNNSIMDIQQALILGIPISDASYAKAGIARIPGFASGTSNYGDSPFFAGEAGIELIDPRRRRVYSNSETRSVLDISGVIAELRALNTRVDKMADDTAKTRKIIRQSFDGNVLNVKTV
jgi:hypothetical protein